MHYEVNNSLAQTNHLAPGSNHIPNLATADVGFKRWKVVIMSNVLPVPPVVEKNGVGCVEPDMMRSGELVIPPIKQIALISLKYGDFY